MDVQRGMTRQAINTRITRKVNHWLKSLPDDIRLKVKDHVIVTGGSITSMLVGEPVNDFDVYFADVKAAKLLADHYVQQFNDASRTAPSIFVRQVDNNRVAINIASDGIASEEAEEAEEAEEITSIEDLSDVDPAALISRRKEEGDVAYRPIFLSENAITLSDKVQLVLRFIGKPDEIHKNYDFIHATNYWYNNTLVLQPAALECTLSRRLVYQGSKYPLATLFRIRKFLDRGWKISAGELVKISLQLSQLDLLDFDVLREQLIGVDAAYFYELIRKLEEFADNGDVISDSYIIELIDELSDNPSFGDGAL